MQDTLALRKKTYLTLLKKRLALVARQVYDYSNGGEDAVAEYRVTCNRLRKAKNLGAVIRLAKEMELSSGVIMKLTLEPFLGTVDDDDLVDIPETI